MIFISHSSKDRPVADAICAALEERGLACWIAHRDVGPRNFGEAIVRAIRNARVMVLVFTGHANASDEIKKELVLASQCRLVVVPVRVEDVVPDDAFAYEFATRQWIDLFDHWDRGLDRLSAWIEDSLPPPGPAADGEPAASAPAERSRQPPAAPRTIPPGPSAAPSLPRSPGADPIPSRPSRAASPPAPAPRRPGSPIPSVVAAILVVQTIFQMVDIGLNQTRAPAEQYPSEFLAQGAIWSLLIVFAGLALLLKPRWGRSMLTGLCLIGFGWEMYLMALAWRSDATWAAHLDIYLAYPVVFGVCLALMVFDGLRRRRRLRASVLPGG